jgi:uncharacterized protein involved in exopolysaccharide biosynthesis
VSRRVETLRSQLKKAEALERRTLKRELGAARSTENRLDEVYRAEVARAKVIDLQRLRQEQLEEEIEQVATAHRSVLAMLRSAELTGQGLAEGRARAAIHVLEAPVSPSEPTWPRPALVLIPCLLLGAMFGLGTAWLVAGRATGFASAGTYEARPADHPGESDGRPPLGQAHGRSSGFISGA